MAKVIIIGGGFGGLSAAKTLCRGHGIDVTLIDKRSTSDFLPVLPDCLGRGVSPDHLRYGIADMARRSGFEFSKEDVKSIDLARREIITGRDTLKYDYLIIASGSETNFYGNESIRNNAYKLDDAADAETISEKINENKYSTYMVGGGGYTGVEVAANLRVFLNKRGRKAKVVIVERSNTILGPLPDWMRSYILSNLKRMGVEIFVDTRIERAENGNAYLSNGVILEDAFVIWAAGVKTAGFIQDLDVKKNAQGRIEVDEYLRLDENCFVVGDASYVKHKDGFLRMAVQFAIFQGAHAARNIDRSIRGRNLRKYSPIDLGYIIPMANNMSCGCILGVNVTGPLATMFHFVMCFYRSWSWGNRFGMFKDVLKIGG